MNSLLLCHGPGNIVDASKVFRHWAQIAVQDFSICRHLDFQVASLAQATRFVIISLAR
jgi:hypothetical protein